MTLASHRLFIGFVLMIRSLVELQGHFLMENMAGLTPNWRLILSYNRFGVLG